jgi:hypothetical protein
MAVEKNSVGAKFPGGAKWHCGVDSVFAGFIACGGDYAALVRAAADDNWFATEIGAIEELDGDEEGVHVHMKDIRDGRCGKIVSVCM